MVDYKKIADKLDDGIRELNQLDDIREYLDKREDVLLEERLAGLKTLEKADYELRRSVESYGDTVMPQHSRMKLLRWEKDAKKTVREKTPATKPKGGRR